MIEYATIPTVTSPTATSIGSTGATLGANVTADGGASITARGTCWGTSAAPTTNCLAEGGTTTGVFTHSRTGLPSNTYIYYRGYATNSIGTGYSADGTFTTTVGPSTGNLISATFDTGYANGVTYNTIMWLGTLGTGTTSVQFQFASSNCSNGASDYPTCSGGGGTVTGPIDSLYKWAWNDTVGWIDFSPVVVISTNLTKWGTIYGDSSYIAVDCATTPPNSTNICSTSNFTVSDNSNNLAGWAWHDTYGWISFCGNSSGGSSTWDGTKWVCPGTVTYQVTVDSSGNFHGFAWNDLLGWISFNCDDVSGLCNTSDYKVMISGASGTWSYIGSDGTTASYYNTTGPGVPVPLVSSQHNNKRYFRYKVILNMDAGSTTPTVNNVIVNWSP